MLDELNPQQRTAVTAPLGPVLVLAGPGSGKTRVLTHRIAHLIDAEGVRPKRVLAVTFTNKAAREMQSRVESLLGPAAADRARSGLTLGTFHAFGAGVLRREAGRLPLSREFVIYDTDDQRSVVKQALEELNLDPKRNQPNKIHAAISNAKNELIGPSDYAVDTYHGEIVQRVYDRYQALLLANNAVDFDDLLMYPVRLLREHPDLLHSYRDRYRHLLVDEFQDTNSAQYALLRLLAGGENPDVFAVGDADQSIYRWRGADYRNVQRFERDFPDARVILLEQNYRSTQTILDAATSVIDRVPGRKEKRLFTERGHGAPIVVHEAYDESDEAQFVLDTIARLTSTGQADPGDCAVMYRINAQSRELEEAFLRAGLPYRLVGAQRFYGRREVKDIIAYLRVIHNPSDDVSLLRIINTPSRGIGPKTVEALLEAAERYGDAPGPFLLALSKDPELPAAQDLGTRAKGALLDFAEVFARWVQASERTALGELVDRVLKDIDYRGHLEDGSDEGLERWENVRELQRVAEEFGELGLTTFLEHIALVSDQDTLTENLNAPILMTLHAAKGLEFPIVFIVGLDEGVFPHQRSFEDPEEMAEERRLFYVGVTRAKDRLYLTRTFRRRLYGTSSVSEPSRFLDDIPADLIKGNSVGSQQQAEAGYRRQTSWKPSRPKRSEPVEPRYRPGMHVVHPTFGEGIVMESRPDHDDEEVIVAFEDEGIKHLLASLASLEVQQEATG